MNNCSKCSRKLSENTGKTPEGVSYKYFKCIECGEEIVGMKQLHDVAEKYRFMKRYHVKLSKWGLSVGLRIPKELVEKYKLKNNKEVALIPEEEGIKLITN